LAVNRVTNDGPELIAGITAEQATAEDANSTKPKKKKTPAKKVAARKPKAPKRSSGGGQGSLF
jgi:hypothetical protein